MQSATADFAPGAATLANLTKHAHRIWLSTIRCIVWKTTSSTKPEVHTVSHCRQRKSESRPRLASCTKIMKFGLCFLKFETLLRCGLIIACGLSLFIVRYYFIQQRIVLELSFFAVYNTWPWRECNVSEQFLFAANSVSAIMRWYRVEKWVERVLLHARWQLTLSMAVSAVQFECNGD